jgi:predicted DNA-binding ribbon-helix-helix protein
MLKKTIRLHNHNTSLLLEVEFWEAMDAMAQSLTMTRSQLIERIDSKRTQTNLASAIRICILTYYQKQIFIYNE